MTKYPHANLDVWDCDGRDINVGDYVEPINRPGNQRHMVTKIEVTLSNQYVLLTTDRGEKLFPECVRRLDWNPTV